MLSLLLFANVAATALSGFFLVQAIPNLVSNLLRDASSPAISPETIWTEAKLAEELRSELNPQDCSQADELLVGWGNLDQVPEILDEVGLDIYSAREALETLNPPGLGFEAELEGEIESLAQQSLGRVIESNPELPSALDANVMQRLATSELVNFCDLNVRLGVALSQGREADEVVSKLLELSSERDWYPRGFTRVEQNLAWGWTSQEGDAPCENCIYWKVTLITRDGCVGGANLELSVFEGEDAIDSRRTTWSVLAPGESVTAEFPFDQVNPELTARVLLAECYRYLQP